MADPTISKRKHARYERRLPVRFTVKDQLQNGIIVNFSISGLFIQTDNAPESGAECPIHFQIGRNQDLSMVGKVVWIRPPTAHCTVMEPAGFGLELLNPPKEYREFVARVRDQLAKDRRRPEERFEVANRIYFRSGSDFLSEYIENLSHGGMYMATKRPLEVGKVVQASLEIPGLDHAIEVEGRVAYNLSAEDAESIGRSSGVGVQFVDLSQEAVAYLHHYIRRLEIHRRSRARRKIEALPSCGSLEDTLVPEILLGLLARQANGKLELSHHQISKSVYFRSGHPIYVESSLRGETLGYHLLRSGKLTREQFSELLAEFGKHDMQYGEILLRNGVLDGAALAEALVNHQEEKLLNTFPWFNGSFNFIADSEPPENISVFALRTHQVVFAGIQRWYDAAVIQAWMGLDEKCTIRLLQMPPAEAVIPPHALRLLKNLKLPKTIGALAVELKFLLEDLLPLVFGAVIAGWVGLVTAGEAAVEKPSVPAEPEKAKPSAREIAAFGKKIGDAHQRFKGRDFYQLFDLPPGADEHKLKIRFLALSAKFAAIPTKDIQDAEICKQAAEILHWIRTAFETLRDPRLRYIYSRRMTAAKKGEPRAAQLKADHVLLASVRDLERGEIKRAAKQLGDALKDHPQDAALKGYFGWALFQQDAQEHLNRATELLDAAIARDPTDPNLHYFRGQLYSHLGNWVEAEGAYAKALRLQPNFIKAEAAQEQAKDKRIALERLSKHD